MEIMKNVNLGLRFILELCALAALGYWGFQVGKGYSLKIIIGVGLPLIMAVAWGMFVSPKASMPATGFVRLLLEIILLGSGAVALYALGNHKLAGIYAIVLTINLILLYVWKQ